jgi:FkbM family methyltransferase
VERTIRLLGKPTAMVDCDESHYLTNISETFETDTLSTFAAICQPHFNVLDIGANIGLTAIALARFCSKGKVFAIEASPDTFRYLKDNIARAGMTNVSCQNMAASAVSGQLMLSYPRRFGCGAFISNKHPVVDSNYLHFPVQACSVDEFVKRIGLNRVDLLKIDVEGFELEVLRGAKRTIERCKPVIYCEVNHWCLNVFQRICLPDFIEEVQAICPHVFAIDADLQYLDLSDPSSLTRFYRAHATKFQFLNLLCGFDKQALLAKLTSLESSRQRVAEYNACRSAPETHATSRRWRHSAPLRPLRALKRYLVSLV